MRSGQTLVSRAICDVMERHPVIRARYSGEYGAGIVPSYEDRPLRETVLRHIRAAGARVWDGCSGADIELLVNVPGRRMQALLDGRTICGIVSVSAVNRVELVHDFAALLEHRLLVLADRNSRSVECGDVRRPD